MTASPAISGANRSAERNARPDVEYSARTVMTRPRPEHTNHSGRAAAAKSVDVPASAPPATEPHSATPMLTPICLLVEVTAEAAPARSSGIPLTAALVIGALTIEKPMPNTVKTTSSSHTGVVALSKLSIADAAVMKTPAISSDGRAPNRPTNRPDSGEKSSAPIAMGR